MKLKFNVLERFMLNGIYQDSLTNAPSRDIIAAQSLASVLGFKIEEYDEYEIKDVDDETTGRKYTRWNEKGKEYKEFDIHPIAVSLLCRKALDNINSDKVMSEMLLACSNLLRQVHESDQKEFMDKEVVDRVEAKHAELQELYDMLKLTK